MPATPEATRTLLEQIGPIRNTHYGNHSCLMSLKWLTYVNTSTGGFYDFTSDLSSKDTAYTSESLESHTDTTYFTDPIVSTPVSTAMRPDVTEANNVFPGHTSASPALPHGWGRRPIFSRRWLRRRQSALESRQESLHYTQQNKRLCPRKRE